LIFDPLAFDDLSWWVKNDRKKALRVLKLIKEVQRTPFAGTGKPEALKHDLAGCWSRRIDREHRVPLPSVTMFAIKKGRKQCASQPARIRQLC